MWAVASLSQMVLVGTSKVRGWNDHGEQGRKEQRVGSGILCALGLEKGSLRTGI